VAKVTHILAKVTPVYCNLAVHNVIVLILSIESRWWTKC